MNAFILVCVIASSQRTYYNTVLCIYESCIYLYLYIRYTLLYIGIVYKSKWCIYILYRESYRIIIISASFDDQTIGILQYNIIIIFYSDIYIIYIIDHFNGFATFPHKSAQCIHIYLLYNTYNRNMYVCVCYVYILLSIQKSLVRFSSCADIFFFKTFPHPVKRPSPLHTPCNASREGCKTEHTRWLAAHGPPSDPSIHTAI